MPFTWKHFAYQAVGDKRLDEQRRFLDSKRLGKETRERREPEEAQYEHPRQSNRFLSFFQCSPKPGRRRPVFHDGRSIGAPGVLPARPRDTTSFRVFLMLWPDFRARSVILRIKSSSMSTVVLIFPHCCSIGTWARSYPL